MHFAWQNEDIQYLIFEHLEPQDLARLAQTCNALFEVATDELWKTIKSITPFLSPLPEDYRRRKLGAEDVQRFFLHTAKIRYLLLESLSVDRVIRLPPQFNPAKKQPKIPQKSWQELWAEIAGLRPVSDIFPNLRRIRINNVAEAILMPLIGISGTELRHLSIKIVHNPEPESVVRKILEQLQNTQLLEYLFVRDGEPNLIPSKLIQRAPLKHLRLDPRVDHAHIACWGGISRHRCPLGRPLRLEILQKNTLEHLTLGLNRDWYTANIGALEGYLPALKTLWLSLTAFMPGACKPNCINVNSQSWTCRSIPENNFPMWYNDIPQSDRTKTCEETPDDCGRRSPALFFWGLANPELSLLNIKFPVRATPKMVSDVILAAKNSCQLAKLEELALAGSGYDKRWELPVPTIQPREFREILKTLLPLPQLKALRLSVAPNFLDILDLAMYKSLAEGFPALETLLLGHDGFRTETPWGFRDYEHVPLQHIAAFCSMLPNLSEVGMGSVDGTSFAESFQEDWVCPNVKKLKIANWVGYERFESPKAVIRLALRSCFPNSDLAKKSKRNPPTLGDLGFD